MNVFRRKLAAFGAMGTVLMIGSFLYSPLNDVYYDSRLVRGLASYDVSDTITLPSYTDHFANVWDSVKSTDQPFFWYIPKAGGLTFQKICSECLNLVSASPKGIAMTNKLAVYRDTADNGLYLNVDPGTTEGIDNAKVLDMVGSNLADIYLTHHLVYSQVLFNETYNARLATMMRHPTKRVIDQFYYKQRATWVGHDNYDAALAVMSLAEFAESDKLVENFVVRSLVNLEGSLNVTSEHVNMAKEILRRKFVVGIMEWYDVSVVRFEKYFGWWDAKNVLGNQTVNYCHYRKIKDGDHVGVHPKWGSKDEPFQKISIRNWADLELYVFAKQLFVEQSKLVV